MKGLAELSLGILNIILSSMGKLEQRGDHLINNSNLFRLPPNPSLWTVIKLKNMHPVTSLYNGRGEKTEFF